MLHPNGNDLSLQRYNQSDILAGDLNLFDSLISESVSEIINYIPDDEAKEKFISRFTSNEDYAKFIQDNAEDIRAHFDPDQHGCKDYQYYTEEVYEDYVSWDSSQFSAVGEVQSRTEPLQCLEMMRGKELEVGVYPCRHNNLSLGDSHVIGFAKNHMVRWGGDSSNQICWDTATYDERVKVGAYACHISSPTEGEPYDSQRFDFHIETGLIRHGPSDRCLEYINKTTVWMMQCNQTRLAQSWSIKLSPWF